MEITVTRMDCCKGATIRFTYKETKWGRSVVATTDLGVCYVGFDGVGKLKQQFKGAEFVESDFEPNFEQLHLYGTDFQIAVWNELIKIPKGETITYSDIAVAIGKPKAVRAVGTAVGRNPIAVIVPCHRVVGKSSLGGYMYGLEMKRGVLHDEGVVI